MKTTVRTATDSIEVEIVNGDIILADVCRIITLARRADVKFIENLMLAIARPGVCSTLCPEGFEIIPPSISVDDIVLDMEPF